MQGNLQFSFLGAINEHIIPQSDGRIIKYFSYFYDGPFLTENNYKIRGEKQYLKAASA